MKDKASNPPKWDREEVVLLVVEYFRTKNLTDSEKIKSQEMISRVLRKRYKVITGKTPDEVYRNLNGIILQSERIHCLDPDTPYNGMVPTKLQKVVYEEYLQDSQSVIAEAYAVVTRYYD